MPVLSKNGRSRKIWFGQCSARKNSFSITDMRRFLFSLVALLIALITVRGATNAYAPVEAVFNQHCLDCHAAQDPEGQLVLESFESLMKGGEGGPVIVPGK